MAINLLGATKWLDPFRLLQTQLCGRRIQSQKFAGVGNVPTSCVEPSKVIIATMASRVLLFRHLPSS